MFYFVLELQSVVFPISSYRKKIAKMQFCYQALEIYFSCAIYFLLKQNSICLDGFIAREKARSLLQYDVWMKARNFKLLKENLTSVKLRCVNL